MAGLLLAAMGPQIYFSFVAGAVVDFIGPKTTLVASNLASAAIVSVMLLSYNANNQMVWPLLLLVVMGGLASSLRDIALQVVVPTFSPRDKLQKYNGLLSAVEAIPIVLGPLLGAVLLDVESFEEILRLDIITFVLAGLSVAVVKFPTAREEPGNAARSLPDILGDGIRWIKKDRQLVKLVRYFAAANFFNGIAAPSITIYVLALSNGNKTSLAIVNSAIATGSIVGGIVAARIRNIEPRDMIIGAGIVQGAVGRVMFALVAGASAWAVCLFVRSVAIVVGQVANDTVWQIRTPANWRGRAFGARRLLAQGGYPVAIGVGGVLGSLCSTHTGLMVLFLIFGALEVCAVALLRPSTHDDTTATEAAATAVVDHA